MSGVLGRNWQVRLERPIKPVLFLPASTGANQYLEREFLDELNEKFHVQASSQADLHRSVPRGLQLEHVLCYQEQRVVQND